MLLVPKCNVLFFAISDKAQMLFLLLVWAELLYCFILVTSEVINPTHNAKLALILHFIENYFLQSAHIENQHSTKEGGRTWEVSTTSTFLPVKYEHWGNVFTETSHTGLSNILILLQNSSKINLFLFLVICWDRA